MHVTQGRGCHVTRERMSCDEGEVSCDTRERMSCDEGENVM